LVKTKIGVGTVAVSSGIASHAGRPPLGGRSFGFDEALLSEELDSAKEAAIKGKVKFFNNQKGFGFVAPDDGGSGVL
jgi:hypothetical protein